MSKGTPKQTIRVDPEFWERFGEAVGEDNRAATLRQFMAWVLREPGAKMPRRPGPTRPVPRGPWEPIDRSATTDQDEQPAPSDLETEGGR